MPKLHRGISFSNYGKSEIKRKSCKKAEEQTGLPILPTTEAKVSESLQGHTGVRGADKSLPTSRQKQKLHISLWSFPQTVPTHRKEVKCSGNKDRFPHPFLTALLLFCLLATLGLSMWSPLPYLSISDNLDYHANPSPILIKRYWSIL